MNTRGDPSRTESRRASSPVARTASTRSSERSTRAPMLAIGLRQGTASGPGRGWPRAAREVGEVDGGRLAVTMRRRLRKTAWAPAARDRARATWRGHARPPPRGPGSRSAAPGSAWRPRRRGPARPRGDLGGGHERAFPGWRKSMPSPTRRSSALRAVMRLTLKRSASSFPRAPVQRPELAGLDLPAQLLVDLDVEGTGDARTTMVSLPSLLVRSPTDG